MSIDPAAKRTILNIIESGRDMSLATLRRDGYPQANLISYANDGLRLYFATARNSGKVANIQQCAKVSLTINLPYNTWSDLKALSVAATAQVLADDAAESMRAQALLKQKFSTPWDVMPQDPTGQTVYIKVTPWLVKLLDYSQGFGHQMLIRLDSDEAPDSNA